MRATSGLFAGSVTKDEVREADRARLVDQFLGLIVQGDVSPKTKETLMKQLNAPDNAMMSTLQKGADESMATQDSSQGQRARRGEVGRGAGRRAMRNLDSTLPAANPEVARIAALILGTPEFQRQ